MESFLAAWKEVQADVWRRCYRACNSHREDAEDLTQHICQRALRGYKSFRGVHQEDAKLPIFRAWILRITNNEINRYWASKEKERNNVHPVETEVLEGFIAVSEPQMSVVTPSEKTLSDLFAAAVASGWLNQKEADVLYTKLADEGSNWDKIAEKLQISVSNAAVLHFRAVRGLRVFLFLHRPDALGDLWDIRQAYEAASRKLPFPRNLPSTKNLPSPLTTVEAEVFRQMIIDRNPRYRRPVGWSKALEEACGKVIRFLDQKVF